MVRRQVPGRKPHRRPRAAQNQHQGAVGVMDPFGPQIRQTVAVLLVPQLRIKLLPGDAPGQLASANDNQEAEQAELALPREHLPPSREHVSHTLRGDGSLLFPFSSVLLLTSRFSFFWKI